MKLNRHNYEEYFILYADNELSSDERRMVEEFVGLNPDLKDELDNFCSTVLLPEASISFDNKEELLRYDDSLISYIDDELPATEKAELEKLITATPSLQKELELYRKTKLQPEEIVFENKSVLYRSTERKVVRMAWVRWAAAAVILLAVSITAITILNNNKTGVQSGTAGLNPGKINTKPGTPQQGVAVNPGKTEITPVVPEQKMDNPDKTPNDKQNLAQNGDKQKTNQQKNINPVQVKLPEDKNQVIAVNANQKDNNLPKPDNNPYYKNESVSDIKSTIAFNDPVEKQKTVNGVTTASVDVTNKQADRIMYTGGPATNDELNPDDEGGQNKKSRGLFRKLTRVFEKNTGIKTTTDDDKLHIMAFTVKLK